MILKRLSIAVLIATGVLTTAWAAGTNPVPSLESFESYNVGFEIKNAQGWSAGDGAGTVSDDAAVLDALQIYEFNGGSYPIDTTHDQVLKLGGDVAQAVDGPEGERVLVDFMLLPLRREEAPTTDSNTHFRLFFDTNGVAAIYHYDLGVTNTVWTSLTNAPVLPTQTWARLTINLDYAESMYALSIDEDDPVVDGKGWSDTSTNATQPGTWFHMPWTNGAMSQVDFEGDGDAYIDDLVIGGGLPQVETVSANISEGSGQLNGFLSWTGFTDTAVSVYWGPNNGGTDPSAWDNTNSAAAPQSVGSISIPISAVPPGVTNAYRFAAINAAGTNWATETKTFLWIQFAAPVYAETNMVPYAEPFEKYVDGFDIENAFGWFLGEDVDSDTGNVTTNLDINNALTNYTAGGGSLPLPTTHEKVLQLNGSVQLSIASPPTQPVRTDLMLKPFLADERPALDSGYQVGLIFNSNGVAEIFNRNIPGGSNQWSTLSGGPTISSCEWTRITFYQDYSNHLYQVSINESGPISHPDGWTSGGAPNGPWFAMPNQRDHMLELAFDGDGEAYVDDIVIGGLLSLVDTLAVSNVTAGAAYMNGFLSYTGFAQASARIYYGLSDGMAVAAAWDATNTLAAPLPLGDLSSHVSGLDTNRLYFYRYAGENTFGSNWADTTEFFFAGAVNVVLVDNFADEGNLSNVGIVKFTRASTATNAPLNVNYGIGGTASNGDDYQALSGAVTIPAGAVEVSVTIVPLRDAIDEGAIAETVEISLLAGPYALGASGPATVSINNVAPGDITLIWDNDSGDRNWNHSSINWIQDFNFIDSDKVEFSGIGTGRVFIGDATYTGLGFSGTAPSPVAPVSIEVSGGIYEFEGGDVTAGATLIKSSGRLVDRRTGANGFGIGPITLEGGEFWQQIPPGTTTRTLNNTNDIFVAANSLLNGNRGDTYWHGNIELKDRLTLNYLGNESTDFDHWFTGTLTINQDTNFPNARILDIHGRDGETRITGNIVDDPDGGHTGNWALTIGSRKFFGAVFAGEITIAGTSNTYSTGTVIDFFGSEGNNENGVTVEGGSKLGTGDVTVKGTNSPALDGARLTLNSADAIDDEATLSLWDGGKVIVPGPDQVEFVGAFVVNGDNKGFGFWSSLDFPDNIEGPGMIAVPFPNLDALLLILR
jgi:hypothetical protein